MKEEIIIPIGITVAINGNKIKVTGKLGCIEKEVKSKVIILKNESDKIILESKIDKKQVLAILNTTKSIIKNMISGVNKKYTYTLRGVYSHFPISLSVKGKTFVISNYFGEKNPRSINIPENVDVVVKGKEVFVTSIDKEKAGIVAGAIENSAKVLNKDRRTFQDGVYIISKGVQND